MPATINTTPHTDPSVDFDDFSVAELAAFNTTPNCDLRFAFDDPSMPIVRPHWSLPDPQSLSNNDRREQERDESLFDMTEWIKVTPSPSPLLRPQSLGLAPLGVCTGAERTGSSGTMQLVHSSTSSEHFGDPFPAAGISNVELIIPTLQILEKRVLEGLDGRERSLFVLCSGRSRHKLQGALGSDWLQQDLNSILYHAYQIAANRRFKHTSRLSDSTEPVDRDKQPDSGSKEVQTITVGRVGAQLVIRPSRSISEGDIFLAELRESSSGNDTEPGTSTDTVTISYAPKLYGRGTGLTITFRRVFEAGSRISIPPIIKLFNIVPYDAEIILLVQRNDLDGVRKLFQTGKASPTDVTAHGHSLLSVSRISHYMPD